MVRIMRIACAELIYSELPEWTFRFSETAEKSVMYETRTKYVFHSRRLEPAADADGDAVGVDVGAVGLEVEDVGDAELVFELDDPVVGELVA